MAGKAVKGGAKPFWGTIGGWAQRFPWGKPWDIPTNRVGNWVAVPGLRRIAADLPKTVTHPWPIAQVAGRPGRGMMERNRSHMAVSSLTGIDESAVVAQAREGDTEAFGELVRRYEGRIFRLAQHVTQNREDARSEEHTS